MKFILAVLLYTLYLILSTTSVSAHSIGQPPYFKINSVFTNYYPVPSTSLNDFNLPQDLAPDSYLVNQKLDFEIDTNALPIPPEVAGKTKFMWEYGDGQTAQGLKNSHAYAKPGTYFMDIKVDSGDGFEPQILQSTAINILPDKNYKLPQAVIKVNNWQSKDPLTDILETKFDKEITFDGSASDPGSSEITEYFWDFGDQNSQSGKTVKYTYKDNPYTVFPLLRVKTKDGFVSDTFVQIKEPGLVTATPPPAQAKPENKIGMGLGIIGGVILAVLAWVVFRKLSKRNPRQR